MILRLTLVVVADFIKPAPQQAYYAEPFSVLLKNMEANMYEKKVKTGLSLTPGCIRQIDDSLSLCGCSSRNELVEKAVRFYISYTTTENNPTILERTITNATYAALQKTEDRLARILFKLAVEHAKLLKVFAEFADLGDLDLRQTQREAYEEVMKSQGIITLDKAVKEKQW